MRKTLIDKNNMHRVCVAPMIDCTDKYFRQLIRVISKHVFLYTEMITSHAILKGSHHRLLAFDNIEHPVALQLGGSCPNDLAKVAKIGEDYGYDEINLNVGCPSPRVQAGRFGACLMKEPELVAKCIESMQKNVNIPVTIKTRIGVDEQESYDEFYNFINILSQTSCNVFIIHARKAWLKGLSPKQNRTIPELKYNFAHQLKKDFPKLEIIVNGGISDLDVNNQFNDLDGIMIGREAYHNPYHLLDVDRRFYNKDETNLTRLEILQKFAAYAEQALVSGLPPSILLKHIYGLSHGIEGGSKWRRQCSELLQKSSINKNSYMDFIEKFPTN